MDFNEYDNNGRTPLMNAAIAGDYDEVKRLIEFGANPNITDDNFSTSKAADFACRKAATSAIHNKTYKLLKELDPLEENEITETPIDTPSIKSKSTTDDLSALIINIILFPLRLLWNLFVIGGTIALQIAWLVFVFGSVIGVILLIIFFPEGFLWPIALFGLVIELWPKNETDNYS